MKNLKKPAEVQVYEVFVEINDSPVTLEVLATSNEEAQQIAGDKYIVRWARRKPNRGEIARYINELY